MLGGEVEEGEQSFPILRQAGDRLVVLGTVFVGEHIDRHLGCRAGRRATDADQNPALNRAASGRVAGLKTLSVMPTSGLCRSSETNPVDIGVSAVITRHNPDLRTDHRVAVKASRMHSRNVMLSFRKHDGVMTTSKNKGLPATADAGQFGSRLPSTSCLDYADVAPLQSLV